MPNAQKIPEKVGRWLVWRAVVSSAWIYNRLSFPQNLTFVLKTRTIIRWRKSDGNDLCWLISISIGRGDPTNRWLCLQLGDEYVNDRWICFKQNTIVNMLICLRNFCFFNSLSAAIMLVTDVSGKWCIKFTYFLNNCLLPIHIHRLNIFILLLLFSLAYIVIELILGKHLSR